MKFLGAFLIVACCGWFGFSLAAAHRQEERSLRQLISALDFMQCELQYRLTSLPDLCSQAADFTPAGCIRGFFQLLSQELEQQLSADPQPCVAAALDRAGKVPPLSRACLEELGKGMGRFDLEGQLLGLEATRTQCRERLAELCAGKDEQRRSYQTLGLCAGAALVILFI